MTPVPVLVPVLVPVVLMMMAMMALALEQMLVFIKPSTTLPSWPPVATMALVSPRQILTTIRLSMGCRTEAW